MKHIESFERLAVGIVLVLGFLALPGMAETIAARVEMNRGFTPKVTTIKAGDVVEFANTSQFVHTVTGDPSLAKNPSNVILPEGAAPFHSGEVRPGDTFRHTFTVPGHYRYVCLPHEMHGMIGEVNVTE